MKTILGFAIACTIIAPIWGLICLSVAGNYDKHSNGRRGSLICISILSGFYGVFAIASTVFLCLHISIKASQWCEGLFCAFAFVLLLWILFDDEALQDNPRTTLAVSVMLPVNIGCSMAGALNIYNFLALGGTCVALFALTFIIIWLVAFDVDYQLEWEEWGLAFQIINIICCVVTAAASIVGFCMHAKIKEEVSVSVNTSIYKYDNGKQEIGEEILDDEFLYYNEYYAVQLDINFSDLYVLSTVSEKMKVEVTFPAAAEDYYANGVRFTSDKSKINWTQSFSVDVKTSRQISSGYFIIKYSYGALKSRDYINVTVSKEEGEENSTNDAEPIFEDQRKLHYRKYNYNFTEENYHQDGSVLLERKCYRIYYPASCNGFKIAIFDPSKEIIYCSMKVTDKLTDGEEYYFLDVPAMLEANVEESVYANIVNNHQTVLVEVTALENNDYADTTVKIKVTF